MACRGSGVQIPLAPFNFICDSNRFRDLDIYTKINIKDYWARQEAKSDKEYSEERKKLENILEMVIEKRKKWEATRLIGVIF